jgi:hypothetical protein
MRKQLKRLKRNSEDCEITDNLLRLRHFPFEIGFSRVAP